MPSAPMIIAHLTLATNRATGVAMAWHAAIAAGIVALILGVRPSRRGAGVMLAAPIVSAAAVALALGNPFNGTILAALALALIWLALRLGTAPVASGPAPARAAGVLLVAFGSLYPHFLQNGTLPDYLYAAPTGVIPCPTLSLVIGFALIAGGLRSPAWSLTLSVSGLFYGLFGVARLGVYLDIPLIAGAAALLILAIMQHARIAAKTTHSTAAAPMI